jgi:hypothetical protein
VVEEGWVCNGGGVVMAGYGIYVSNWKRSEVREMETGAWEDDSEAKLEMVGRPGATPEIFLTLTDEGPEQVFVFKDRDEYADFMVKCVEMALRVFGMDQGWWDDYERRSRKPSQMVRPIGGLDVREMWRRGEG